MFEAAIMPAVARNEGGLRPLDWHELAARLDAARDLRGLLARPLIDAGSFACGAGRLHAGGERPINLSGLGRGKAPAAISAAAAEEANVGDQGTR